MACPQVSNLQTGLMKVPAEFLIPEDAWVDKDAFAAAARKLAWLFIENFKEFESGATPEVKAAGPRV
jgi:phosphoenolpyruvate carboxykinase (ATP)